MSSELRVKCFFGDGFRAPGPGGVESSGRTQKSWVTRGDSAALRSSLDDLLEHLGAASGDYVVKVVVHRKLVPTFARPECPDSVHEVPLQRAPRASREAGSARISQSLIVV